MTSTKNIKWLSGLIIAVFVVSVFAASAPNLIGAFFVKGKVGLKWMNVTDATEYVVYRQEGSGEFQKLDATEKTNFFDVNVSPGSKYTYKIAAVVGGAEVAGTTKSLTIPGQALGAFEAPSGISGRYDSRKGIYLKWDKVGAAMAYNIYRSSTAGGEYEVVGNASTNKHLDNEGIKNGETYYYVVTAMDEMFEETPYSAEAAIQAGETAEEASAMEAALAVQLDSVDLKFLYMVDEAGPEGPMLQPTDVFLNSLGDIYISDYGNRRILCFKNNGDFKFSFGFQSESKVTPEEGSFTSPMTLFIDDKDQVYVSDVVNCNVQVFDAGGKFIKRVSLNGDEEGKRGWRPNGMHVLSDGRIITTDAGNMRVLIVDQSGAILKVIENESSPAPFTFPDELTVTKDNLITIVDPIGSKIQQFDLDGNFVRHFGSLGNAAGMFGRPKGVTTDESGMIWVSDGMGNTIQGFSPEGEIKVNMWIGENIQEVGISSPRGIFLRDNKIYFINRILHQLVVLEYQIIEKNYE